jgi:hypothetical protein
MENEKVHRTQMIYGYAVCIVAVITFLISISVLVNASIDLSDPLNAYHSFNKTEPSLASFENYKMDLLKSPEKELAYVPDEATLRSMYEAAKNDVIQKVKHESFRSIIVNSLITLIALILFIVHWFWMRRISK